MKEKIRVATYNVGDYSGIGIAHGSEESRKAFTEVMKKTGADLWALQEDVEFFEDEKKLSAFDEVYSKILPNYRREYTGKYNGKAFLTKFEMEEPQKIFYDPELHCSHKWFLKTKIAVNGMTLDAVCLHFDWSDNFKRTVQIKTVCETVKDLDRCLVIGDFNPDDYDAGKKLSQRKTFPEDLAHFQSLGFEPANAGRSGCFDTIVDPENFVPSPYPCDNILVSRNVKILSVGRIAEPWMNDHAILYADIEIT
ncbi:MAG: endonuclease/exonuclease/phosphatase family protein [Clostridia bacterium]|nr:endonuclease/exonuclease/phosphatase family protein [Clostridia bacterium]